MSGKDVPSDWKGKICIFLSAVSLALILALMAALAALIAGNSLVALWPGRIERATLADGTALLGRRVDADVSPDGRERIQFKVGNRECNGGADFLWVFAEDIIASEFPQDAVAVSRTENGEFFGFLEGTTSHEALPTPKEFAGLLADFQKRWNSEAEPLRRLLADLGERWQQSYLSGLKAAYEEERAVVPEKAAIWRKKLEDSLTEEQAVKEQSEEVMAAFAAVNASLQAERVVFSTARGERISIPLSAVVDVLWPNRMGVFAKGRQFLVNAWDFVFCDPREANTECGIFPALFGTAMLVFLMAISAFPLGVAAGIYLREYAGEGVIPKIARVAVNNLAGVPSIVFGIFGLGFFIYGVGGNLDAFFFPERVAAGINTFGGGSIIWSSLTLGLLTLPVVIVATEEALATVPAEVRQGSLALGATKFQTLWRVVLPMASPGILTGFILAMARAAGEVAPLMLTGAVKSAPGLPLDGAWPFIHLERKFMHLGFHIYDMGFQSPNIEASKPMVYLTALALLSLVFVLNAAAFSLRRRMREKYAMRGF